MSFKDRKNAYWCRECGGYVVTIDIDDGVTPMFLACRVLGEPGTLGNPCKGRMSSMMYPREPWPERDGFGKLIPTEPEWEWYRLTDAQARRQDRKHPGVWEHHRKGGLSLRRIGANL